MSLDPPELFSTTAKKINGSSLSVRKMRIADLKMVMSWCKEEGWNVGKYDASLYYFLDREGHLIFLLDGQPIGAIALINYGSLLLVGLFIVKKGCRGKGYGAQIWQYSMQDLKKHVGKCFALYAVPAQVSRYKNSDFNEEFNTHRWKIMLNKKLIYDPIKKIN